MRVSPARISPRCRWPAIWLPAPIFPARNKMVWARRVDANHGEIIRTLRKAGCAVLDLSRVGQGAPDILVSLGGRNHLLELKSGNGKLTDDQEKFIAYWRAQVHVVRTPEQALEAVGF